jgi:hypothetical protein
LELSGLSEAPGRLTHLQSPINIVVTVALVIWLLQAFGLLDSIRSFRIR